MYVLTAAFVCGFVAVPAARHPLPLRCSPVQALRPGSIKEATLQQGKRPYGEESRRYRRTIYRHEDWLRHRSDCCATCRARSPLASFGRC